MPPKQTNAERERKAVLAEARRYWPQIPKKHQKFVQHIIDNIGDVTSGSLDVFPCLDHNLLVVRVEFKVGKKQ